MAKRISEKQIREIIDAFIKNQSLEEISKKYNFTKLTISRHLKKNLGEDKFTEINKLNKSNKRFSDPNKLDEEKVIDNNFDGSSKEFIYDSFPENTFLEIAPLNLEIENTQQKDLSSVSIKEVELPKVVYMIVGKQVELETKFLKEYVEWNFLSEKDLSRKTIEIFFDLKSAKRSSKKDQRVIKVPNSDVFKITAPILLSRGISRIVSSEVLIAL
ncbi:hypothetical protein CU311_06580 [Prochlorococcus marinus str. MU1402]|uniref:hypothetical protein n=1 Tax=Prochlorococcus marinus TaxID=1219 RepID=UPI001ADBBAF2|nr:hypothetical protein [Prochlorococcus marinus]MBO8232345.1 hypothetical protein [Prochlorococcus marinus XMU1402]MBW3057073.1 hypothetical protein [Prochlorococcus marinus str. MU1402]